MRNLAPSMTLAGVLCAAALVAHSEAALAQEAEQSGPDLAPRQAEERRRNDLHEQPAVRHRLLLVAKRLELTPLFEGSINADFRHFVGVGLKAEYHLSDMFSVGALGVYSGALDTGLVDKIVPTLPDTPVADSREPSKDQFLAHLNKMPLHGAAYVSVTPWYGKIAAFEAVFFNFDFYFQAGVSFAQLESSCPVSLCDDPAPGKGRPDPMNPTGDPLPPDLNPRNDAPLNSGSRIGAYLGGGIHVFLNDFIALDLTVRDYLFMDNPSGADYDANGYVNDDDSRFLNHLFMGVGVSIMLPFKAKRTR